MNAIFSMLVDRENPCKLLPQVTNGVIEWIDHFLFGCKVQVIFTAYQSEKFFQKFWNSKFPPKNSTLN